MRNIATEMKSSFADDLVIWQRSCIYVSQGICDAILNHNFLSGPQCYTRGDPSLNFSYPRSGASIHDIDFISPMIRKVRDVKLLILMVN